MTSGRWLVLGIIGVTAVFAAAQWWFQTRAYYAPIERCGSVRHDADGRGPDRSPRETFEGIDADTSPLRFRVCFTLDEAGLAAAGQGAPVRGAHAAHRAGLVRLFRRRRHRRGAGGRRGRRRVLASGTRGPASTGSSPSSPMAASTAGTS
jgi:hypothetical protein